MEKSIFRKKSLDRISSPEQLNDYIRVANPSVWMMLAAVILLLTGICVWGVFGKLDTTLTVAAVTEQGSTVCYVPEADMKTVKADMPVLIGQESFSIREMSHQPVLVDDSFDPYVLYVGGFSQGDWVYPLILEGVRAEDGSVTQAKILIERVAPMHFVLN